MKIEIIGNSKIIMSNPTSMHNYFAWPTVAKLQNGKIAVVSSGFRVDHVCPFGKAVISYSEDEGETYTLPAPVIDTILDDRDAGITTFGENGVIVTSFHLTSYWWDALPEWGANSYIKEYVKMISEEEKKAIMGSNYRVSYDGGVTFGEIYKAPVTSPHGPVELQDGSILWVGHPYVLGEGEVSEAPICAYTINLDGTAELLGEIPHVFEHETLLKPCEPHAIQLDDGSLICHIRLHPEWAVGKLIVYQSESTDGGRTWTVPHRIEGLEGVRQHI